MHDAASGGDPPFTDTVPLGPAAPQAAPGPESHPFRFTGTAREFFAIWIVNLFLTIITLGIYSAWAKVRKKRYFYGHTWVADANFEYHGNPVAILKGRLIAVVAFAGYSGLGHFMPKVAAALALVLFACAPWFIARSMAFNAWNSSYRNIRFHFRGTYTDVLKAIWPIALFLVFPLLAPDWDRTSTEGPPTAFWLVFGLQMLTFAVAYPYAVGSLKRLHVNQSRYGASPFSIGAGLGAFYKTYLQTYLVMLIAAVIVGGISVPLVMFASVVFPVVIVLAYFGIGAVTLAFSRARIGNLVFNSTSLDPGISFASTLATGRLTRLYFVNLLAILLTLGLAVPWAVIRVMRYRAECLSLQSVGAFDELVAGMGSQVGATGEELGEFFNIDLSL